jgi:SET domain-containing protein
LSGVLGARTPPGKKLEVRASGIEGKGVFSLVRFRRSQRVGELWGEVISTNEATRRARKRKHIAIVELDEALAIDALRSDSPFRYINHSCQSNSYLRIGDGWVRFYARRDINRGEELTCDYGETQHEGKLPCRCGSPDCRRFL